MLPNLFSKGFAVPVIVFGPEPLKIIVAVLFVTAVVFVPEIVKLSVTFILPLYEVGNELFERIKFGTLKMPNNISP